MSKFYPESERPLTNAPLSTTWRRERLLRMGSTGTVSNVPEFVQASSGEQSTDSAHTIHVNTAPSESSALGPDRSMSTSYGTLPPSPALYQSVRSRRGIPALDALKTPSRMSWSLPGSPRTPRYDTHRTSILRTFAAERPISAYDQPINEEVAASDHHNSDTNFNGVRVWYSSYTSIDWLHDAIKDAARFYRLRKRHSFRARLRLLVDRSLGWVIVTIVGFLTAVAAFLVVKSEQWLFDLKEGYCTAGWSKAKRFCCPSVDDTSKLLSGPDCRNWVEWSEVIAGNASEDEQKVVQYIAYTVIALLLATLSCLLTISLTKGDSFATRKESGVLAPGYSDTEDKQTFPVPKGRVMYYAAGSGIPEIKTILSGFVIHGYLGGRTLFTKSVGLALSVASGLSLGKEGPFVHIGSCIGNIVSRVHPKYENNEGKRREILSAACAAGVAVAFGAPIGGTLFSLEEVSYFFPPKVMWRSFFCAMIAAITLKFLDPFRTGKLVLFQVTYVKDWHAYELLGFVILGVVGGVYGAYFSKLYYRWIRDVRQKTWLKRHPVIEVLMVTLITSIMCFMNPYTRMGGTELVYHLFSECHKGSHSELCVLDPSAFANVWPVIRVILIAMVVKAFLTVITFGLKVPAGIFIPTLGVGACAGRVVGILMRWQQATHPNSLIFKACGGDLDCVVPGLYAMVGAAAALSGVTRTTVSLAVIMFELTDTLTYAVPVMLAVLVAKTVADALEPKGIYDLVIELNQLPYLDAKQEYLWGNVQISDVIDRDVNVIRLDQSNTVRSLCDQLRAVYTMGHDDAGFPILKTDHNGEGYHLVGYIGAGELEHALAVVADAPDEEVKFNNTTSAHFATASISSLSSETGQPTTPGCDLFDFSVYTDQAPLTVQINSPLELVHRFFVKLGARYVVVTDSEGLYEGLIDKKTWLAFLSELEDKS